MSRPCEQLDAFADGELDPVQADAFRGHLAHCPDCPGGLRELLALQARVRSLPPQQLILPGRSVGRPRRWWALAPVLALLALALFWTRVGPSPEPVQVAGLTRAVEGRLSHPLLAAHRPYDAARSGTSQSAPLPLGALARLEAQGDSHGVADAYLDRGELGQAEAFLRGLPDTADVRSDRAALALAQGEAAAALKWAEAALAQTAQHPAARWNRALALGQLGLTQLAARELRSVETLGEPGWAQEAKLRAAALEEAQQQQRTGWERLRAAGEAMVAGGPVLDAEAAAHHPGLARLYWYDALRTAADPARLDALRPLAVALDGRSGGEVLQRLLAQVTPSPSLAADYLRLTRRETPAPDPQALLAAATRAGRTELALGVMLLSGAATAQPQRYQALAAASGDPWFLLLAEQTLARAQAAAGDLPRAEETLGRLLERCPLRGLEYRCGLAAIQLAQLRVSAHRLDDAAPLIDQGEAFARAAGDWGLGLQLLALRAEAARLGDALSVAAATLQEHQLRSPEGCATQRYLHLSLATIYFQQGRAEAARAELVATPDCGEPLPVQGALLLGDLQRFGAHAAEEARARTALEARLPAATAGEALLLQTVLGRLELATGNPAGADRLREVIARQGVEGPDAARARGYAFSSLAMEAAAGGRFEQVVILLAAEQDVAAPSSCAVAVAVDDERRVFAVLDARGGAQGLLQRAEPGAWQTPVVVPEALLGHLEGCAQVAVLARPPVQGAARLLPATWAWSFGVGGTRKPPVGPERRVIVTDVQPPVSLGLRALAPFRGDPQGARLLRGAAATPEAVLAAARSATELQLHVHGRVGGAVSGAAHLVLSPDPEGAFALGAEAIRSVRLEGAPTVVLAACDSGQVAAYLHRAWGLPQAFREAGARAVFAARGALPDASSAAFFDGVLGRIRAGEAPARALRDERVAWLDRGADWVSDVVLFE